MSLSLSFFFFSSRRRHTRLQGDWSSDVCSSDLRSRCSCARAATDRPRRSAEPPRCARSGEHTSELQSPCNLVCRLLLEKKKKKKKLLRLEKNQNLEYTKFNNY